MNKTTQQTPLQIAKRTGLINKEKFILLHPEASGFGFKFFWSHEKQTKGRHIVIATNPRVYKTKAECIRNLKYISHGFITGALGRLLAYDHHAKPIDLELKYDVVYYY